MPNVVARAVGQFGRDGLVARHAPYQFPRFVATHLPHRGRRSRFPYPELGTEPARSTGRCAASYLLLHPTLQWLGQRSYGCYLYHLMLPVFYQRVVYHLFTDASVRAKLLGALSTALLLTPMLLVLTAASWRWLEAPLDRFKHRLLYTPASAVS